MGGHWPNRFRPRGNPLQAAMQSCRTYFDGGVSSSCAAIYSARRNRIASLCTYCSKNGLHSTEPPRLAQRPPGTAAGNHDVNRTHSTASKHPTPDQSDVQLLPEMFPRAVYIHMPFCMKRCHFCAFPVTLLPATPRYPPGSGSRPPDSQPRTGNFCSLSTKHDCSTLSTDPAVISPHTSSADLMEIYVETLCEDIAHSLRGWRSGAIDHDHYSWLVPMQRSLRTIRATLGHQSESETSPFHPTPGETRASEPRTTSFRQGRCRDVSADLSKSFFRSIYFGGGSPSLIPPRLLQRVLAVLETEAHSLERSTTRGVPSSAVACRGRAHQEPGSFGGDSSKGRLYQPDAWIHQSLHETDSPGICARRLCDELSIEIDPSTIDSKEHLEELAELGVTRFSVGVQTFDDTILKRLGRSNDRAANVRVLRLLSEIVREYARRGRKLSVSTDILLSFQRRDQLLEDLRLCTELGTSHISLYAMQVERHSAFGRTLPRDIVRDDEGADLLTEAHHWLVHHEFEHYEISSFARIDHHNDNSSYPKDTCDNVFKRQEIEQGYRCLHHEAYWRSEPFFGFGMGASSFVNLHRWTRPNRLVK